MHNLKTFLLALLIPLGTEAQVGVSYFAAQGFSDSECNEALAVFKGIENPAIAILWGTFTTHNLCLQKFLARYKDKQKTVEIHFSNEAGRRNKRLHAGELKVLSKKNIEKRVRNIQRFIDTYGPERTSWYVSTGLEDNYTRRTFTRVCKALRQGLADNVRLVRAPMGDFYRGCADVIELHGYNAKLPKGRCIQNGDGHDINFGDGRPVLDGAVRIPEVSSAIRRARSSGCKFFAWWSGPQGVGPRFVEPRSRRFRVHRSHVRAVNKLLRRFNHA